MSIFVGGLPSGSYLFERCSVSLEKTLILCLQGLILAGRNLEAWQELRAGSNTSVCKLLLSVPVSFQSPGSPGPEPFRLTCSLNKPSISCRYKTGAVSWLCRREEGAESSKCSFHRLSTSPPIFSLLGILQGEPAVFSFPCRSLFQLRLLC